MFGDNSSLEGINYPIVDGDTRHYPFGIRGKKELTVQEEAALRNRYQCLLTQDELDEIAKREGLF